MGFANKIALSNARERFRSGLAKRGKELRPLVAAFSADPSARIPLAALQRRLHALLASAQLFEETSLVELLQTVINRLDAVGLGGEPWRDADREQLLLLLAQLGERTPNERSDMPDHADARRLRPEHAPSVAPAERESSTRALALESTPSQTAVHAKPPAMLLVRVLLVCSRPHAVGLRTLLDDAPVELLHAADPEQALALLHSAMPDCALVAAEFATLPDIDLVRRLRMDPLARLDGVYLLMPAGASCDADFVRQSGADGVLSEPLGLEALTPMLDRATRRRGRGGLRALRENPRGTIDEIASYVAEEVRVGIVEGLRSAVAEPIELGDTKELAAAAWSAIGRVRAHLAVHSRGRAPGQPELEAEPEDALQESTSFLLGKRVLVADDDPAVLWFVSGVLREAGAQVVQASDGRAALDLARRKRPQVILSDILMPHVDGFTLCRELRRDVLLERVPVILLSWKEDLLERMRELRAGAGGYLRKDARGSEVLAAVGAALKPRMELIAALRETPELSGDVETLGVVALLDCVAEVRPNATLVIEDAWRLFEIELRDGVRIAVTRTAADGSFTRGERALVQLLGVHAGRFSVEPGHGSQRGMLAEPMWTALQLAGQEVTAVFDALSGPHMEQVALLTFDERVLAYLLSGPATRLHETVAALKSARSVQQLLADGAFSASELESQLRELARHGAITGVWSEQGEDLLASARGRCEALGSGLARAAYAARAAELPRMAAEELDALRPPTSALNPELATDSEASQPAAVVAPAHDDETYRADSAFSTGSFWAHGDDPDAESEAARARAQLHEQELRSIYDLVPRDDEPTANLALVDLRTIALPDASISVERRAHRDGARLALTLVALAVLGFFGAIHLEGQPWQPDLRELWQRWGLPGWSGMAAASVAGGAGPIAHSDVDLGVVLPYIDMARGVRVDVGEGLLVIELGAEATPPEISVDGLHLGTPPIAIALPAAQHQLVLTRGGVSSTHAIAMDAGKTRWIVLPRTAP